MKEALRQLKKGLTKELGSILKLKPSKYEAVTDNFEHKFPSDAPIFGKPNVLINPQRYRHNEYVNAALSSFGAEEIVALAEKYSGNADAKQEAIDQIFKSIKHSLVSKTEFGITDLNLSKRNLQERRLAELQQKEAQRLKINSTHAIRLLDRTDSSNKQASYMQALARNNEEHLKRVTNNDDTGVSHDFSVDKSLIHLQI